MNKISLEAHRDAPQIKHPRVASAVLLVLAAFACWLASENYVWAVPLAVILLVSSAWNWRR